MTKLLHIALIIILLANVQLKGQQKDVDKEIDLLFEKIVKTASTSSDSTLFFATRGIEMCTGINDPDREIYFHGAIVLYHIRHGEYSLAHNELDIFDKISEERDNDKYRQFGLLLHGNIFSQKEMYVNALKYYYAALDLYSDNLRGMDIATCSSQSFFNLSYNPRIVNIRVLANIAFIMRTIGSYDKAVEYIQKIKDDIESYGDEGLGPIIPKFMKELAFSYAVLDNDRAETTFMELKELLQDHIWEDRDMLAFECNEGLAKIYVEKGRFDEAKDLITQCKVFSDGSGSPQYKARYHNLAGRLYREMGEYEKCIEECTAAYLIDSTAYFTAASATYNIGRAYDKLGDKKMADLYFGKNNRINIKNSSRNYQSAIADLEQLYNSNVKDWKIAELTSSKHLIIVSFTLLLVIIIISIIYLVKFSRKKSQLIAARSVIEGELKERKRVSRDLHDSLIGDLVAVKSNIAMRDSEDGAIITKMLDDCIDDVRYIAHNIMPPSLKYGLKSMFEDIASHYGDVSFHFIGTDINIDELTKHELFCITSELLNNAHRHANATHIDLQLIERDDFLSICIQDDGCGFDTNTTAEGFGLKSIRSRIEPYRGTMSIDSEPGCGTEITVTINVPNT